MGIKEIKVWKTVIESTLDFSYNSVKIPRLKALELQRGIQQGSAYLLILGNEFNIEIVKAFEVLDNGILLLKRAQFGTMENIWAAGTLIQAKLSCKLIEKFQLDLLQIKKLYNNVFLANNGDLITTVY